MKKIIALYDGNLHYCNRFTQVFHQMQEMNFQIISFTNEESLLEYLNNGYIDILLDGVGDFAYEEWNKSIKVILYLTEEDNDFISYPPKICKYQNMESIWMTITSVYQKHNAGQKAISHKPQKIITFLSLNPMEDYEQYCFSFGHQRSKHEKLLYISMDLIPTQTSSYSNQRENLLSELIYHMKEYPHKTPEWNNYIDYHGSLSILKGVTHGLDLISLNQEDAKYWLSILQDTEYTEVMFFLNTYTEFSLELLASSDETYIIIDRDYEESGKLQAFMGQVNFMNLELPKEKVKFIYKETLREKSYIAK